MLHNAGQFIHTVLGKHVFPTENDNNQITVSNGIHKVFYVVHIFDVLFDIGPQIIKEQQEKEGYSELFSLASDKTHDIVKIDGSPTNSNYNYNVLDGVLGLTNIFPSELSCESYS